MKTYLKIKICSLAEEAKIIKREEHRWWKLTGKKEIYGKDPNEYLFTKSLFKKDHPLVFGLREHRIHVVRTECRSANIAYGYMRGRAYKQIEHKCYEQPNWERIATIIRDFSGSKYLSADQRKKLAEDLKTWAEATEAKKAA